MLRKLKPLQFFAHRGELNELWTVLVRDVESAVFAESKAFRIKSFSNGLTGGESIR